MSFSFLWYLAPVSLFDFTVSSLLPCLAYSVFYLLFRVVSLILFDNYLGSASLPLPPPPAPHLDIFPSSVTARYLSFLLVISMLLFSVLQRLTMILLLYYIVFPS